VRQAWRSLPLDLWQVARQDMAGFVKPTSVIKLCAEHIDGLVDRVCGLHKVEGAWVGTVNPGAITSTRIYRADGRAFAAIL